MAYKYSFQNFDKEIMARASATNLAISLKFSVETLKQIRGKKVSDAISFLKEGFPVKVAQDVLKLVESAVKNASEQELGDKLYIISASARKGTTRYHYGRYSGRQMKSSNVEIVVGGKK